MSLAAGTEWIPIAIGLVVGVAAFLAWATWAVRRQQAETTVATPAVPAARARVLPPEVRVVVKPQPARPASVHYVVAAPDDEAVLVAMMLRVRPPVPLRVPAPTATADAPKHVPAGNLPRSA